ncbi:MAG: hypothetical protein JJT78_15000 [Leptospira sp.]|nr:hypothetical protein [Leptospira sp.]
MKNLTTLQKNSHIPEPSKYFDCNGNMPITSEERIEMIENLENKFIEIFDILRVDRNDPNSTDSPRRMAKMWVKELFKGRFEPPPELTVV